MLVATTTDWCRLFLLEMVLRHFSEAGKPETASEILNGVCIAEVSGKVVIE